MSAPYLTSTPKGTPSLSTTIRFKSKDLLVRTFCCLKTKIQGNTIGILIMSGVEIWVLHGTSIPDSDYERCVSNTTIAPFLTIRDPYTLPFSDLCLVVIWALVNWDLTCILSSHIQNVKIQCSSNRNHVFSLF